MTDEDPEPFRMPADPDEEAPAAEDEPAPAGKEELAVPTESIADLIDEATRTAAEQAEAERRGDAPEDRSADVWGEPAEAPVHDRDAVWQQAEDDDASNVWDLEEDGDAMWGSGGAPTAEPTPTAKPTPTAEPTPTTEPTTPRETPAGPPAAAAGMPVEDELEPETFTFAVDEGQGATPAAAPAPGPRAGDEAGDEEPETFSFPAGPDTTAPAALPDEPEGGGEEPETFTFAVDDDLAMPAVAPDQPVAATAEADEVEEWTVPSADAADEESAVDNDVWTFSVKTDQDTPLADAASPRDDAGWHDLEAEEESGWEVADLGPRGSTDVEESDAFIAAVQARDDDEDDDAPWTAPALADDGEYEDADDEEDGREDQPSADVVTAEVHDALGDLLGNGEQDAVIQTDGPATPAATAATTPAATTPAASAPDPDDVAGDAGLDDFDHLEDFDDLDHLDDMAAAAVAGVGHDQPGADDASTEEDAAEAEGIDQPLDAPTAARQVMEPGSVTFSSGGKKKRGLFG